MKKSQLKILLFIFGIVFFCCVCFSQTIVEEYRLGNCVEGSTYISQGENAGKFAFADGRGVYLFDLSTGSYERIFRQDLLQSAHRSTGLCFISQGDFTDNLLLNGDPEKKLNVVTFLGNLVAEVTPDFSWWHCEGITEITSGPYSGMFGMIGRENNGVQHIFIFCLEKKPDGTAAAYLEKDIVLSFDNQYGICFLPDDFPLPEYRNHFVLSSDYLTICDFEGIIKISFPVETTYEGLTYISQGIYQGKIMIADVNAKDTWIMNIDGTEKTPYSITVGVGIGVNIMSLNWNEITNQMLLAQAFGTSVIYFISRTARENWVVDFQSEYQEAQGVYDITPLNSYGYYYLLVSKRLNNEYFYEVHQLEVDFNLINVYPLQERFYQFCYVPSTLNQSGLDKFVMLSLANRQKFWVFDNTFSNSSEVDLSDYVDRILDFYYDKEEANYYILDEGKEILVFNAEWNLLEQYDISTVWPPRGFDKITNISSGELKGTIGLVNNIDCRLFIISLKTEIEVDIDIKPGSYPNSINLGSNGNVPVAIFSTAEFDATNVDPTTVSLAGAEVKVRGKGTTMSSIEDVNGDGLLDLIVHVDTTALELSEGDTEAILVGETYDAQKIRGVDTIRIVQE